MKKISAVLLVLVLVGSVAFAGFTGNAEANFKVDFDNGDYGFANPVELTSDIVFYELLVDKAGEGDIYAEIKAELTLAFDFEDQPNENDAFADGEIVSNAEITSAKIIGDNWYVGILGAMSAPNFASSAIDEDNSADEDPLDLDPSDFVEDGAGIEVGYADYVFGLSVPYGLTNNNYTNGDYDIFASVVTPDFALGDGLTLAFGAAGRLANVAGNSASGSVKGAYEMDDVTASVAADLIYDGGLEAEVAVNAVIDPVTLDVYFATLDDSAAGEEAYDDGVDNILSAKAAFAVDKFDIEVTAKDILNASILGVSVDFAATEAISVNVNGGYTLMGVNEAAWYAGAGATYTAEKYVASVEGTYASDETLAVEASIESEVLVDGATLSLSYETADILTSAGFVVAAVNIAF
ncbi:MAG TPA: hypothetical protein DIW48_06525 [Sphaerochaeta sp.]|nr:hypothetical protein [Sphaerochaeta sp.]HCS36337.1 hypothetical protein [Sphaerochaeta sp.]